MTKESSVSTSTTMLSSPAAMMPPSRSVTPSLSIVTLVMSTWSTCDNMFFT